MKFKSAEAFKDDCRDSAHNKSDSLLQLKNEKILITGGTGFVGTWLAEMLAYLNDNHNFGCKIYLLSKNANNFSIKAPHLSARKDIQLIEKDVLDIMEIQSDTTYVIHAAATPDNRKHFSDPLNVMNVISRGTDAVLSAVCRLPNIKKLLNISSGLIYGAQPYDIERIPESFNGALACDSIASIYSESKRFAEALCTAYRNLYKIPVTTARPFAFVGPYQLLDKPWAVNNFIYDSLNGGPIRILGDENTVRSYMYASDMAFWLLRILAAGQSGKAYNVGSPEGVTLKSLAEKIASQFPDNIEIVRDVPPNKIADKSRFVPDTNLVQETLGLEINISLEKALKRTIVWYKNK